VEVAADNKAAEQQEQVGHHYLVGRVVMEIQLVQGEPEQPLAAAVAAVAGLIHLLAVMGLLVEFV
jgi:hypothetical protein